MTTASQRGKRNRNHGHKTERMVVRWLKDNGYPDAHTTRSRLGHDGFRQPYDIGGTPWAIEVKGFMKSSAWPTWRAQALDQAGDRIPIVVRRTRGVTDVGLWEAEVLFWRLPRVALNPTRKVVDCPRTKQWWVRLPFGELVEALR